MKTLLIVLLVFFCFKAKAQNYKLVNKPIAKIDSLLYFELVIKFSKKLSAENSAKLIAEEYINFCVKNQIPCLVAYPDYEKNLIILRNDK